MLCHLSQRTTQRYLALAGAVNVDLEGGAGRALINHEDDALEGLGHAQAVSDYVLSTRLVVLHRLQDHCADLRDGWVNDVVNGANLALAVFVTGKMAGGLCMIR